MRRVILYIAMSLDGYIAGEDDDLSFLDGYEHVKLVQSSYGDLMAHIDTIIMGRKTYDWILKMLSWPYEGYQTIVLTSTPIDSPYATMVSASIDRVMSDLKEKDGKDIWLVGGGQLASQFIKKGLVDEMVLAFIPKLLGKGIPLFQEVEGQFHLVKVEHEGGLILATYQK